MRMITVWDKVAFGAMLVVLIGIVYAIVWLGDLPGKIAQRREHPQRAAIHALSWLGLIFTGGVLWIVAMVWAYMRPTRALVEGTEVGPGPAERPVSAEALVKRVEALEAKLGEQKTGGNAP